MSAPVLLLDNITKRFGDFTTVDVLCLHQAAAAIA